MALFLVANVHCFFDKISAINTTESFENQVLYLDIVDGTLIFDNSYGKHELIAQKIEQEDILIFNKESFNNFKKYYDKKG